MGSNIPDLYFDLATPSPSRVQNLPTLEENQVAQSSSEPEDELILNSDLYILSYWFGYIGYHNLPGVDNQNLH